MSRAVPVYEIQLSIRGLFTSVKGDIHSLMKGQIFKINCRDDRFTSSVGLVYLCFCLGIDVVRLFHIYTGKFQYMFRIAGNGKHDQGFASET